MPCAWDRVPIREGWSCSVGNTGEEEKRTQGGRQDQRGPKGPPRGQACTAATAEGHSEAHLCVSCTSVFTGVRVLQWFQDQRLCTARKMPGPASLPQFLPLSLSAPAHLREAASSRKPGLGCRGKEPVPTASVPQARTSLYGIKRALAQTEGRAWHSAN